MLAENVALSRCSLGNRLSRWEIVRLKPVRRMQSDHAEMARGDLQVPLSATGRSAVNPHRDADVH